VQPAGAQWEKASEVFEEMQAQGCTPDVVTYTALISSYEKGGQWRRALAAYNQMRHRRCQPDAIVYNAIIDALWETGVIWAQRQVGLLSYLSPGPGGGGLRQVVYGIEHLSALRYFGGETGLQHVF